MKLAHTKILTNTHECCKCLICCILEFLQLITDFSDQLVCTICNIWNSASLFYLSAHYFLFSCNFCQCTPVSPAYATICAQRFSTSKHPVCNHRSLAHSHTHTLAHTCAYIVAPTCRKKLLLTHSVSAWWMRAQEWERERERKTENCRRVRSRVRSFLACMRMQVCECVCMCLCVRRLSFSA